MGGISFGFRVVIAKFDSPDAGSRAEIEDPVNLGAC